MNQNYRKTFPNFIPPQKMDSELIIKAKQYIQSKQRKIVFPPKKKQPIKTEIPNVQQSINIPEILSISISNQMMYSKSQRKTKMIKISSRCIPITTTTTFRKKEDNLIININQQFNKNSQNNSTHQRQSISPWVQ